MGRRKGRKKRVLRLAALILILSFIYFSLFHNSKKNNSPISSPNPISCPQTKLGQVNNSLGNEIKSQLAGTHGSYSIVVKNLKTNEAFLQNENQIVDSASLYKLWVMAVAYQQIQEGKMSENQVLSDSYVDLNKTFNIDPKLAEKTQGTVTTTVKDALIQMVTVSDNYSALLLARQMRLSTIQNFLDKDCFTNSKVGINGDPPTTSASDIASFFEKLYRGKLADPKQTEAMINLLKQQKFTDKIPKYLPYTTQLSVAHKTGELDPYSHDAGIVYAPNGDYIIVVLSKSDSRDLANERIANISKAVYNFFNPGTVPSIIEDTPISSDSAK